MKKIVFTLIILFSFMSKIEALSIYDMQVKLDDLSSYYNYNNVTNSKLEEIKMELNVINMDILEIEEEIKKYLDEINDYEKIVLEKRKQINEYLKALQVSNLSNEYLEYIFDSSNYTEFIYKYGVVTQLSEYNNGLIMFYNDLINELNDKKEKLSVSKNILEAKKNEFVAKLNIIRANNMVNDLGGNLYEDIILLENKINYYKSKGYNLYDEIDEVGNLGNSRWNYPLKRGCVTNDYVNGFNVSNNHYGIDLDCVDEGSEVYSVNKGIVSYVGKYSCGGNFVYIYHNVNSVEYTSVYMHLLSVNVYEGEYVDENTVIGLMGGYSTSTLYGGYDMCSKGAHLHFGISYGYNITTDLFNINSFDPRSIFSFPLIYYDSNEFFNR